MQGENSCTCGGDCEGELGSDNACGDGCCSPWDCAAICEDDCDLCNDCGACDADGQQCVDDTSCSSGHCDFDLAGAKRCHATGSSCVQDMTGAETDNGSTLCVGAVQWRACTGAAWGAPQGCSGCQSCQSGACFDDDSLCVPVGWDGCDDICVKTRSNDGICLGGACQSASAFVAEGKVCQSGTEIPPWAGVNCDTAINCETGECGAAKYHRGCSGGDSSCVDTDRQFAGEWVTALGDVISQTEYKLGTSCSTAVDACEMSAHCTGDVWYAAHTCDGTGACDADYLDVGCCNHTDCGPTEYCSEVGHICTELPICKVRGNGSYDWQFAPAGTDDLDHCTEDLASTCDQDGTCDGNGGCRLWPGGTVCAAQSCQAPSTLHAADQCDGDGLCVDSGTSSCAPYACNDALDDCRSDCGQPEHCADGFNCNVDVCE